MRESEQAIYDQIERELGRPVAAALTIDDAATTVLTRYRVVRFRDNAMVKARNPYEHFVPMDKEMFERVAYPLVGGIPKRRMNDVFAHICGTADSLTPYDRYILFGAGTSRQTVWDMEQLVVRTDILPDDCVWRSPYTPLSSIRPIKLIMDFAGGDMRLYSDIMQSLAPLIMAIKPVGVIWWIGDNMDGKNVLIDALNKIFPDQLSNLTVKQLNGGRCNTPLLNGVLGNVAEDRGGQITNTEIYKSIGAHEDFSMHRYHSQNGITVRGNVHHIFSAARAPTFYTRNLSIDRRTHAVPFNRFDKSQAALPSNFYGQLLAEMCKYATLIKQQGYRYDWSGVTAAPKLIPA